MKQRKYSFLTFVDVVRELNNEGFPRFSRLTFRRMLEKHKHDWPLPPRTENGWRRFSRESVDYYKALIKKAYGFPVEIPPMPSDLQIEQ